MLNVQENAHEKQRLSQEEEAGAEEQLCFCWSISDSFKHK